MEKAVKKESLHVIISDITFMNISICISLYIKAKLNVYLYKN